MADQPLLYYRTKEQIDVYRAMPAEQKIRKLEMEMELMYYMRLERARFLDTRANNYSHVNS